MSFSLTYLEFTYVFRKDAIPLPSDAPPQSPFIVGVMYGPVDIDPHQAWDSASFNVIDQVCEGLYAYNFSDPKLTIVPRLAMDMGSWTDGDTVFTVDLRTNVTFHDGTPFNAVAVKWNFDRLYYLMEEGISQVSDVYKNYDHIANETKYIINETIVVDADTVQFKLNTPYAPFHALLCFTASYMMSPTSTNPTQLLDTSTDILVGTGPFTYNGCEAEVEVRFHAFDNYLRGKADIEKMIFSIITDADKRNKALLAGDIDFLERPMLKYLPSFEADPNITVLDTGITTASIQYLGMNNKQINKTFRQAISYAINYSYILEEIVEGNATRLKSPVPNGIRYANDSFNFATLNLTHARFLMQSMGYGIGFDVFNDAEWVAVAEGPTPFEIYNYTYNIGNEVREDIFILLQDNLKKIGIKVTDAGMTWGQYIYRYYEIGDLHRDMLQLYFLGWIPDYNDPSIFINQLMTNRSIASNGAQINDWYLQDLMEQGISETNLSIRRGIYEEIQRYCVEDLMPWAFAFVFNLIPAYHKDLSGFQPNALEKLYFYPCQWDREGIDYGMDISHPSDIAYFEGYPGNSITWIITADNILNPVYYIHRNGLLIETNSWALGIPVVIDIDGLSASTYEYRIEVHNGDDIVEDIVIVIVNPLEFGISHPPDIEYTEGETGNNISWIITATNVSNPIYNIYRNDSLIETNSWASGVPVVIDIDGLSAGTHEYRIEVHNGDDIIEDIVIVIINPLEFGISRPPDIIYTEGETGNNISWIITATIVSDPIFFIYRNGSLIETNSWESGVPVSINVDHQSVGTYKYKIEVHNAEDIVIDVVIVTVLSAEDENGDIIIIIPGFPVGFLIGISIIMLYYIWKRNGWKINSK